MTGQVVIVNEGPSTTANIPLPYIPVANTTQQYEIDMMLSVLGLPLPGQAAVRMETRCITLLIVPAIEMTGRAQDVTLRGLAGDLTASLRLDQPMHMDAFEPSEATIRVRGAGGTGMFEGVNVAGELKGMFRPSGTLYLTFPSSEAAVGAVRRGLAQNATLSDAQRLETLERARQALAQAKSAIFPREDASETVVMSAIHRTGDQVQVALRIVVPAGDASQMVRAIAIGPDGPARTLYQGVHAPGESVTVSATGTPPFIVQVYVGGAMVKQITIPAQ